MSRPYLTKVPWKGIRWDGFFDISYMTILEMVQVVGNIPCDRMFNSARDREMISIADEEVVRTVTFLSHL